METDANYCRAWREADSKTKYDMLCKRTRKSDKPDVSYFYRLTFKKAWTDGFSYSRKRGATVETHLRPRNGTIEVFEGLYGGAHVPVDVVKIEKFRRTVTRTTTEELA